MSKRWRQACCVAAAAAGGRAPYFQAVSRGVGKGGAEFAGKDPGVACCCKEVVERGVIESEVSVSERGIRKEILKPGYLRMDAAWDEEVGFVGLLPSGKPPRERHR